MTVTMWKARFLDPFGKPKDVQTSGLPLAEDTSYYSHQFHKGHLCCAYCETAVHYNHGVVSTLGSSAQGRKPHFVTFPEQKHDDRCLWQFRDPSQSIEEIDPSKGYRIHVNTREYSELFNKPSGVYENGHIVDQDMVGRERLVVKDVRDLVALLERGEWNRINDSVIVFGNEKFTWEQFCVHDGKWRRIFDLMERAQQRPSHLPPLAMIQVTTDRRYDFRGFGKQEVPSKPVLMAERDERGNKQEIRVTVDIRNRDNTHVMGSFSYAEGSHFVLAPVRHKEFKGDFKTIHYLNIAVTNAEQVVHVNIENIVQRGRAAAQKRDNSGDAPSAPTP